MYKSRISFLLLLMVIMTGCAITQKPASVLDTGADVQAPALVASEPIVSTNVPLHSGLAHHVVPATQSTKHLELNDLAQIARAATKSPVTAKKYADQTLSGQAKFIKAPKGNPNAVVADVRVTGLGEVSLWCRNVKGAAPAGRVESFEGVLTGSVYTSEDFSHDVTMKDCRFHD